MFLSHATILAFALHVVAQGQGASQVDQELPCPDNEEDRRTLKSHTTMYDQDGKKVNENEFQLNKEDGIHRVLEFELPDKAIEPELWYERWIDPENSETSPDKSK